EPSGVTEADAENIALGAVPGKVTDIAIEMKLGKLNYVVEVQKTGGEEVDVIIDRETGKVLLIES
ncbi:MAG: PepSY domain-containing protein, partial [Nanoarchaeota archaeon]|nr:PepSY domain-containing protein [Nanoarchaeota archaeon]